jgi:hypothetical protein
VNHADQPAAPLARRVGETGIEVGVLFASPSGTLSALKTAAALAVDLDAHISLICVQVVPYTLPLERPPVSVDFLAERLRSVADEAGVPVEVHLYFARDVLETLEALVHPDTILVSGRASRKLIKHLLSHGYSVVLAEQQKTSRYPVLGKLRAFRQLSGTRNHPFATH